MLMYSPLSAYFDDVIPQQPALSNDGKQRQPALGDFSSPIDIFTIPVIYMSTELQNGNGFISLPLTFL
jgi:hypothetical protein